MDLRKRTALANMVSITTKFKFGAHQFLWKSHWTDGELHILDQAHALGLTLLEISLGDDVQFDRARVCRHAEALGIELTVGPGNLWPEDCNILFIAVLFSMCRSTRPVNAPKVRSPSKEWICGSPPHWPKWSA